MAENQDFKMDGKTLDITKENIAAMKQLFPEVVTDGKVDFEKLRLILGDEIETSDERYNFTWHGKNQAIRLSQTPSMGTLRPCKEDSVNWDTTKNLYIEGDNLEVLKLLQRSYFGRIKMIYFDPPYNTGNDFVYKDDYKSPLSDYLTLTKQTNSSGFKNRTNIESDGRFHTNWLSMIYPRLKLSRNLLSDNGLILISIDDCEVSRLRLLCDELFGESNFVCQFIWRSRQNKDNRNITGVSIDHEYLVCYSKSANIRIFKGTERKIDQYSNPDNDPRGPWTSANMVGLATKDARPNLHYDLINPNTGINYGCPDKGWRYDRKSMNQLIVDDRIIWPDKPSGRPRKKSFLNELSDSLPGYSSVLDNGVYTNTATKELMSIFDFHVFDFPKPVDLLSEFILQTTDVDDIVLDCFSGSATIAHAVLKCNNEEKSSRKFICIQLPEQLGFDTEPYKHGFKTICDIGIERIRRVVSQLELSNIQKTLDGITQDVDYGFRVFSLDSSNIKEWSLGIDLRNSLLSFENNLISDPSRNDMDIVFEILLKLGLDLNSNVEERQNYYSVENGTLMICLKDVASVDVAQAMIEEFKEKEPLVWKVIFKDNGFVSDDVKANTRETLKMAGLQDGSFITL